MNTSLFLPFPSEHSTLLIGNSGVGKSSYLRYFLEHPKHYFSHPIARIVVINYNDMVQFQPLQITQNKTAKESDDDSHVNDDNDDVDKSDDNDDNLSGTTDVDDDDHDKVDSAGSDDDRLSGTDDNDDEVNNTHHSSNSARVKKEK